MNISSVIISTINALVARFGGATVHQGEGFWTDEAGTLYQEPVYTITTAYQSTPEANKAFKRIAIEAGAQACQKSVYVRDADGQVSIVPLEEMAAHLAA